MNNIINFKALFLIACFSILISTNIIGQRIIIESPVAIVNTPADNNADSLIVLLPNGIVGIRDAKTIVQSNPFYLGQDTLGGIVCHLYVGSDNYQHGLLISKTEGLNLQWQSSNSVTGATSSFDGQANTDLIVNSPAKNFVTGLGAGWYMPAIDEMMLIRNNRYVINQALFDGGYGLYRLIGNYWASTEETLSKAYYTNYPWGNAVSAGKSQSYYVRGVKKF